jgi:tetratricopeptide (TPR) repeat protein
MIYEHIIHPRAVLNLCHSSACTLTQRSGSGQILRTKNILARRFYRPRVKRGGFLTTSAASTSAGSKASEAVEKGLKLFGEKQYEEALRNFQTALESQPRPEESQAALYNSACCQIKLNQWQAATDSVSEAINNFRLPLKTAMEVIVCTVARSP